MKASRDILHAYVAINQLHLELLDEIKGNGSVFKQKLKHHLKEADKLMSGHAAHLYEVDENAYNDISKFADVLINSINTNGYDGTIEKLNAS